MVANNSYSFLNHLTARQTPIHKSPSDMPVIPSFRLLIPNIELLWRILARCFSSCDIPEA